MSIYNRFIPALIEAAQSSLLSSKHSACLFSGTRILRIGTNYSINHDLNGGHKPPRREKGSLQLHLSC